MTAVEKAPVSGSVAASKLAGLMKKRPTATNSSSGSSFPTAKKLLTVAASRTPT
jgi:hypothetical protein